MVLANLANGLAIAVATTLFAQDATVADGIAAWRDGDAEAAIAIWTPLARGGNRDARFNLGQAYRLGRGVPKDEARARTLFEQAAKDGHLGARTNLGLMLFGAGEQEEGLEWLRGAANAGEARAMLVYGTALFNGRNISRDMVTGYALVSRAAAKDLAPAKTTLAEMDRLLPVETRREGVALAQALASGDRSLDSVVRGGTRVAAAERAAPVRTTPPAPPIREAPTAVRKTVQAPSAPTRPAADPAPSTPRASTAGWTVQLGAFSRDGAAQALFDELKCADVFEGKRPLYRKGGGVTRLRVGPFDSKAAAQRACAAMSARGQACFPVEP